PWNVDGFPTVIQLVNHDGSSAWVDPDEVAVFDRQLAPLGQMQRELGQGCRVHGVSNRIDLHRRLRAELYHLPATRQVSNTPVRYSGRSGLLADMAMAWISASRASSDSMIASSHNRAQYTGASAAS